MKDRATFARVKHANALGHEVGIEAGEDGASSHGGEEAAVRGDQLSFVLISSISNDSTMSPSLMSW